MVSADNVKMVSTDNVVSIIGNLISVALFLSPLPTIAKIRRRRAVEEFSPKPYLVTLFNCMLWMFYSLPPVHPSTLVAVFDGVGVVLELFYICIFIYFADNRMRWMLGGIVAAELSSMAGIAAGVILGVREAETRSFIVGVGCVICGVAMNAAPFSTMKAVRSSVVAPFMSSRICCGYD
uniref:Uncharacterized protein n=1 Tax=Ananas comosus var. bracteatus TaxID=296719 RepID=A0A6V7NZ86_ANACO|nr:unnamed protein product [Ananas comosus var. bracteatus]